MDSGYYAACSALKTQSNALEIVANNIANVSTVGYRGQMPAFESLMVQTADGQMNGWERLTNEFAALNGSRLNMAEGNLEAHLHRLLKDFLVMRDDFTIERRIFFGARRNVG